MKLTALAEEGEHAGKSAKRSGDQAAEARRRHRG
jgi:hypothetical protein